MLGPGGKLSELPASHHCYKGHTTDVRYPPGVQRLRSVERSEHMTPTPMVPGPNPEFAASSGPAAPSKHSYRRHGRDVAFGSGTDGWRPLRSRIHAAKHPPEVAGHRCTFGMPSLPQPHVPLAASCPSTLASSLKYPNKRFPVCPGPLCYGCSVHRDATAMSDDARIVRVKPSSVALEPPSIGPDRRTTHAHTQHCTQHPPPPPTQEHARFLIYLRLLFFACSY